MAQETLQEVALKTRVKPTETLGLVDFAQRYEDGVMGGEEAEDFLEGLGDGVTVFGGVQALVVELAGDRGVALLVVEASFGLFLSLGWGFDLCPRFGEADGVGDGCSDGFAGGGDEEG